MMISIAARQFSVMEKVPHLTCTLSLNGARRASQNAKSSPPDLACVKAKNIFSLPRPSILQVRLPSDVAGAFSGVELVSKWFSSALREEQTDNIKAAKQRARANTHQVACSFKPGIAFSRRLGITRTGDFSCQYMYAASH